MGLRLDHLGIVLFDASVSASVFFTVVMLTMLVCRQPARRLLVARAGTLASLLILPLVTVGPLPRFDVINGVVRSEVFPALLVVNPDQLETQAFSPPNRAPTSSLWSGRVLAIAGLTGIAVGVAWLVLGCAGVAWLVRNSTEPSERTRSFYEELSSHRGVIAPRIPLRVCARTKRPVAVGFPRPAILIPRAMDQGTVGADQLRLTLLHELAHAEQSDPWFNAVATLAQAVWFFLPQIWWIRSQMRLDQEFMADCLAAAEYGSNAKYASSLFAIVESRSVSTHAAISTSERPAATGQFVERRKNGSSLSQRLLMLLHCPYPVAPTPGPPWSIAVKFAVVSAAIGACCFTVRWPDFGQIAERYKAREMATRRSFHVESITSEPFAAAHANRSMAYQMPLLLPPRFELTVEVQASHAELPHIRIAGNPLGTPAQPQDGSPADDDPPQWHKVRLAKTEDHVSLWVDGQKLNVDPNYEKTNERLTIEPTPDHEVSLRELNVVW
jgi:beta-lactamase regulating signal transducer with metallopeptidase domain